MAGNVTRLNVGMSRNATCFPVRNNFSVYRLSHCFGLTNKTAHTKDTFELLTCANRKGSWSAEVSFHVTTYSYCLVVKRRCQIWLSSGYVSTQEGNQWGGKYLQLTAFTTCLLPYCFTANHTRCTMSEVTAGRWCNPCLVLRSRDKTRSLVHFKDLPCLPSWLLVLHLYLPYYNYPNTPIPPFLL
jgi:hypothetical protein